MAGFRKSLQGEIDAYEGEVLETLSFEGDRFVKDALNYEGFKNLASSIGYVILKDGEEILYGFPDENFKDSNSVKKAITEIITDYNQGFVLIAIAGFGYAAAVENLGFDIITGNSPNSKDIVILMHPITI